jgi:alkylation response protein AidB-like acyl-CoA dehydrogenase
VRFSRVCFEEAIKYAHKRKTFGVRLIDHAVIRNKLAVMAGRIEAGFSFIVILIFILLFY